MLTRRSRSRIMRGKIELHVLLLVVIPSLLLAFAFLEASAFGSTRRNPPPPPRTNGPPPTQQQQQQIRRQGLPHDSPQQSSSPPNSNQNPPIGHRRINNHHHHGPPPPPKHRGRPPFPFPRRRPGPPPPPRGRGPPPPRERENNDNRHNNNNRPPPHYNKPPPQNTNSNDPPPKLSFHIPPAPISSTNIPPPPPPQQLQDHHHQRQPQPPHPTTNAQASEPHVQVNFQHPGFQNQQFQQQQFPNTNPSQQPHLMLNNHPQFPTFNPPPQQPHLPHTGSPPSQPPTSQQPHQPFNHNNNNPFNLNNQFQQAASSQQPPPQFNVLNPSQQPIQFNNNNVPQQPFQHNNNVFNQFQNQQPLFNNNNNNNNQQQPVFGQINPQAPPNQPPIMEYAPPPNTFNAVTPHPLDNNLDKSKELELNSIPKQTITFTVTPKPSKNGGTQLHFKISTPKPFKTTLKPITNSKGYFKGSTYRPPVDKLSTKFKYPPSNPGYPDAEYRVQDGSHHDSMSAEMEPPNQNPESIKDVLTMNSDHQLNQPRQPHPDDTDTYAGPSYNSPPVFVKPGSGEHVLIAGMNSGKSAYHKGSSHQHDDDDLPPFRTNNPYDEDYDNGPIVAHDHPPFEEEDIGSKSYSDRHLPYGPAKDNAFDNEEPPFRRPGSSSHSVEEGFDEFGDGQQQQQQRGKGKQRQQLHIHEESLASGETKRGRPGHSKYSQPDPLYHPEEDRGSESKEQNNGGGEFTDMSPPGRFEGFGSGFSGENDAPRKNQDYVPRSRGDSPSDDNKDPQKNTAEELLAALGLSTNPLVSMPSNKYPVDVPTKYSLPGSWEKDYTETENKRKPGAGGEPMGLLEYLNQKKDEDGQPGNQQQQQQQEHHATEPLYSVPDRQIGGSAENSFVVKGSMKTGGASGPIEPIAKPSSNVVLGRPIPHFTGTEPDFPRSQQQQPQQSSYVETNVKGHAHHVSSTGQESYLYEKIHGHPAPPHEHHHNHDAHGVPVINTGLYGPSVPPPISGPGTFTNSPPLLVSSISPPLDSPVHYVPQAAQHPHQHQAHAPQIGTESYLFQKVHAAKPALAFGPTPPSPHSVEDVAALGVPGLYGTHLHAHPHTGLYASQSEQIAAASSQPAGSFSPQGNVNNGVLLPVGMGVQQPQPQQIHHRVDQSGVYSHPSPTPQQQQQQQQQILQQSASQVQQVQQQPQQVHHILHHVPQPPPSPPTNTYANGNTGNEPIDRIHQGAPLHHAPQPQQQQQQQLQQQYALPPGYVLAQQQPNANQYNPQHLYVQQQQQQPDHSASGSSHQYVAPQNLYGAAVTPRYGEAYPVYVTEPDPIIEIIVQDSNMTLPAMPTFPPPPPPPPPTPEPVHVFYVKYSQKNNTPVFDSFYGPSEPHIQLEQPISSIPVRGPDRNGVAPDDGGHDQMSQSSIQMQHHNFNQLQQEPSTTAAPQSPTTLRTVIRPDRNEFAHASTGLVVSFDQPAVEHEIFANYTQNLSNQQQAILQQQQNEQAAILQQQQQQQFQQQQALYQQQSTQQKAEMYPDLNYPAQYAQHSHQEAQQPAYPNLESLWPGITDQQQQKQLDQQSEQQQQQQAAAFQQQGFGKRIGLQELASLLETSPSGDQQQQQQPQRDDGQAYQDEQNNPPPLYQYVENNHHQQTHHQATANRQVKLPDDVPEELRNQLVQSGILGNADVQVINYSENLFKELGELPPEALAAFQAHTTNTGGNTKQLDQTSSPQQQQLWSGQEVNLSHTDLGSLLPQGRSLRSVLVVKNSLRPKRGGKQRRVVLLLTSANDVLLFRPKDKSLRRIGDTSNPVIQRVIQLTNHRFDNEEEVAA